jgi:hypothetical protein
MLFFCDIDFSKFGNYRINFYIAMKAIIVPYFGHCIRGYAFFLRESKSEAIIIMHDE